MMMSNLENNSATPTDPTEDRAEHVHYSTVNNFYSGDGQLLDQTHEGSPPPPAATNDSGVDPSRAVHYHYQTINNYYYPAPPPWVQYPAPHLWMQYPAQMMPPSGGLINALPCYGGEDSMGLGQFVRIPGSEQYIAGDADSCCSDSDNSSNSCCSDSDSNGDSYNDRYNMDGYPDSVKFVYGTVALLAVLCPFCKDRENIEFGEDGTMVKAFCGSCLSALTRTQMFLCGCGQNSKFLDPLARPSEMCKECAQQQIPFTRHRTKRGKRGGRRNQKTQ